MSAQIAIEYPGKRIETYFQDEARFGHVVGMLSPYINVEVINIFLELFVKEIPKDAYVVMVRDQAGFHMGNSLTIPQNITIVPLPPY